MHRGMHSNLTSTLTCALTLNMCSKPLISVGLKDTFKSFEEQGMVMGLLIHLGLVCVLQCLPAQTADKEPESSNNPSASVLCSEIFSVIPGITERM